MHYSWLYALNFRWYVTNSFSENLGPFTVSYVPVNNLTQMYDERWIFNKAKSDSSQFSNLNRLFACIILFSLLPLYALTNSRLGNCRSCASFYPKNNIIAICLFLKNRNVFYCQKITGAQFCLLLHVC